ncbi:MAG: CBS domain-containing protein [Candidatus Woesearchaeota archaeon]|nr:CBS domain-containing protein [Candidatus Woesearchaeota archaeon]
MEPELSQIKSLRMKVGITQSELAKASGVSQSLIAKIESGRIDPSFSKAKKILDTLKSMGNEKGVKAKDVMSRKIIFVSPGTPLKGAIEKMRAYGISQLPVIDGKRCIGMVTETGILEAMQSDRKEIKNARDVLQECAPIVSKDTPISDLSGLLSHSGLILVSERGEFLGVITKTDIIRGIYLER